MPGDLVPISQMDENTPVRIDFPGGSYSLSAKFVLNWIAPGAPFLDALRFLLACRLRQIDPMNGEAHLIRYGDKWQTVIGKDGYIRMAEDHPDYAGHQSGIIIKHPETLETREIEGAFVPDGWGVIGGWARVFRKGSHPTYASVGIEYYQDNNPSWQTRTSTMYRKTALIHAIEESGLIYRHGKTHDRSLDRCEVESGEFLPPYEQPVGVSANVVDQVDAEIEATPLPSLSPHLVAEIQGLINFLEMDDYKVQSMLARRGVKMIPELSDHDAHDIIQKLGQIADREKIREILLPDPPAPQAEGVPDATTIDQQADEPAQLAEEVAASEVVTLEGEVITPDLPKEEQERLAQKVADQRADLQKDLDEIEATDLTKLSPDELIAIKDRHDRIVQSLQDLDGTPADVVKNFGIADPEENDIPDLIRPEKEAKPRNKKKPAKA